MNTPIPEKSYSAFLPIVLIALSSLILLGWNLFIVINQHSASLRIIAQQDLQIAQANQVETKLKQMMTDLVDLAKEDTDAATIVKRYGIAFKPPAGGQARMPVEK